MGVTSAPSSASLSHEETLRLSESRPAALVVFISTVGASDALSQVLTSIPRDTSAAFIAFPDVRRGFTGILCERLRAECGLVVQDIGDRETLRRGHVYVVPVQSAVELSGSDPDGAVHLTAPSVTEKQSEGGGRIRNSCQRIVDVFGDKTVAVMLAGMAGDGVDAAQRIKAAGGRVVAQNEATALVFDGPRALADANMADDILPLWAIGSHLSEVLEGY